MSIPLLPRAQSTLMGLSHTEALAHLASNVAPQPGGEAYRPFEVVTGLASAARTVTTQSSWFLVPTWARALVCELECSAAGAAGSIKPKLTGRKFTGSFWTTVFLDDTVGLAASTGSRILVASSVATATFCAQEAEVSLLFPEFSITVTHATADSYTYAARFWFLT